jgi:hypothetical protein
MLSMQLKNACSFLFDTQNRVDSLESGFNSPFSRYVYILAFSFEHFLVRELQLDISEQPYFGIFETVP